MPLAFLGFRGVYDWTCRREQRLNSSSRTAVYLNEIIKRAVAPSLSKIQNKTRRDEIKKYLSYAHCNAKYSSTGHGCVTATLNPTPSTLHHAPCTLIPEPGPETPAVTSHVCSLIPDPYIPNPSSYTVHPQSNSLNPAAYTRQRTPLGPCFRPMPRVLWCF